MSFLPGLEGGKFKIKKAFQSSKILACAKKSEICATSTLKFLRLYKYSQTRLYKFLKKHNVVYKNQYGFQSNVSTVHAMLDVVTYCYDNINESCYTALSFVDLRKAFDTVSHKPLLIKLSYYGIRGVAYYLIHSYLHNRQQLVSNNQSKSDLKLTHCGGPQGSSLGPLFFLVYMNDLNFALKSQPRLFADDTCLIVKGLNPEQLQIKINSELQNLHQWCWVNKLSINTSKTNIIIISPKQTNATIPHPHLTSSGSSINIFDSAKYLGVVIDNELNFKQRIKIMEGKVARPVGILSKLKHFFPQNIMLQLYYALVHSLLSYGINIWGATYPTYIKRLKSLQNRAIRAVARCHYRDEVKLSYNQFKILQIDDLLKYEIAKFVHCNITNKTPKSFCNYFCKTAEHSSRVTRQSSDNSNLYIPRYRTINRKGA